MFELEEFLKKCGVQLISVQDWLLLSNFFDSVHTCTFVRYIPSRICYCVGLFVGDSYSTARHSLKMFLRLFTIYDEGFHG